MNGERRVVLRRDAVLALRPHAEAFAEAVAAGARAASLRDRTGRLSFAAAPLSEIQRDLAGELHRAFSSSDQAAIHERSGSDFPAFVDRVLWAWLRAEPTLAEFLLPDPRGSGGFLFEVLRAELAELHLDLVVESRPEGARLVAPARRRRAVLPLVAGAWLGATLGWLLEMLRIRDGVLIGLGSGLGLGGLLAMRLLVAGPTITCSECGAAASSSAPTCERCGTRFVGQSDEGPGEDDPGVGKREDASQE